MKYNTILFDFGDTLTYPDPVKSWQIYNWVPDLIKKLYNGSYKLGIISNTHRYQDGWWVRNKLAEFGILHNFEMVISSATYGIHKPDYAIFQKAIDFMELDPTRCIMVGDSVHCDGACRYFRMTYLPVQRNTIWKPELMALLNDTFPETRRLSSISEYKLYGDKLITRTRHLSEVLKSGDTVLVGGIEYAILDSNSFYTKEDILKDDSNFIEFTVRRVN